MSALLLLPTVDPAEPLLDAASPLWLTLLKSVAVFGITMTLVPLLVLAERRVSAWMQYRVGPNRVGIGGSLQPMADLVKMLFKEELKPDGVPAFLFTAAPAIAAITALSMMAVVPFGGTLEIAGRSIPLVVADVDIGVLAVLALSSIGVYGITLGGWASNSKYSLLGGLRSSAQMISYELTLGIALLSVLVAASGPEFGSFKLSELIARQAESGIWNCFKLPLGFVLFTIAAFAETNRLPFDLPEAEPELVGGYHTEYSSMRFGLFFLGEYAAMVAGSAVIVCLFLGGWHFPYLTKEVAVGWGGALTQVAVFLAKVLAFLFFFIHVRWTLPRLRYDQLMNFGWKWMLPLSLLNLLFAGIGAALGWF
ncbi:MAG: NADH-quinone oxidoreductase subunit NuoH [Planctomycetes bacterium]|nr:NADH-quinone oxidoreductase subunit NuoH [Planctomycetota bacterium]